MTGRLAIDFGTSNTVLAVWDPERKEGTPLHLPEFGRVALQGGLEVSVVPSLIHYAKDGRRWIGNQVLERGLYHSRRTFRWMKRYISHRSPIRIDLDGQEITPYKAGRDFLSTLLRFTAEEFKIDADEEVALSVPVEAYEHYENWLASVAEAAGMQHFRLIDEPSAAALGYGTHIQPGSVYLIFDFGGGTLHASVVLMEPEAKATAGGQRCRVLGKAGHSTGGSSIDQWIFEEVLRRNGHTDDEDEIRRISTALLVASEQVKEQLSFEEAANLSVTNPDTDLTLEARFTRSDLESLLEAHGLYTDIHRTIRAALNSAHERGYVESDISAVFMVGGSSLIPSVNRLLRQNFGTERVLYDRPLDAIARGAAAFAAGVEFFDHIQHDYAIRYVDPNEGQYHYHPIVQQGTPYPTEKPLARLAIKAAYDGQRQLGLAIFEMGRQNQMAHQPVELVFDPSGAARIIQVTPHEQEQRSLFWMNENSPTFLPASPPVREGEPQFEVEFRIDENKRLVITARDLKTGRLAYQNYPVVRLT